MNVTVNGSDRDVPAGTTLRDVIASLGVGDRERGVAAAVDGAVVPRSAWETTHMQARMRVEVVRAAAGG